MVNRLLAMADAETVTRIIPGAFMPGAAGPDSSPAVIAPAVWRCWTGREFNFIGRLHLTGYDTLVSLSQKNKLADYVREWTAIGLSCEPANRAEAESAADEAYRAAGLPPPTLKIWLQSPFAGLLASLLLNNTLALAASGCPILTPMGTRR